MADLLATVADLRALLEEDGTTLPDAGAELVLEMATAAVQAAAGQDILEATSTITLMGTTESWLQLPQQPVTAVAVVELDGVAVTDHKRFGARLWRRDGWAKCSYEPSVVEVTYTHGFPPGDQGLQLARSAVLAVAAQISTDPTGKATGFSIDDYREQASQGAAGESIAGLVPSLLQKALRKQYGRRGGLVRIG